MKKDKRYEELLVELESLHDKYKYLLREYWDLEEKTEGVITSTNMVRCKNEMKDISLQTKDIYNKIQKVEEKLSKYDITKI